MARRIFEPIARSHLALAGVLILSLAAAASMARSVAAGELLMVWQQGCYWCEKWDEEIGPVWPKTEEARRVRLRKVAIDELPDDISMAGPVNFTPTFILVADGREVGRLEGYPGEDFFWPLIDQLIDRLPEAVPATAAQEPDA